MIKLFSFRDSYEFSFKRFDLSQEFAIDPSTFTYVKKLKTLFVLGILVSTTSVVGKDVNGSYVRFAQRHQHHDSKQPIMVVYTDDGMSRHPNYISPNDEGTYCIFYNNIGSRHDHTSSNV